MTKSVKKHTQSTTTKKAQPRRGWKWPKRIGITLIVLLALYTLFGFFGVAWIVKHIAAPKISERLTGAMTAQEVSFNPYTLAMVIEGLEITDEMGRVVIGFDRFEGQLRLLRSIFQQGWTFGHARLYAPVVEAELDEHRALNLASLLKPTTGGEPLRKIPHIVVEDLLVSGATINMRDLAFEPPIGRSIRDLEFTVARLDTDPSYENPYELMAQFGDDASIDWRGTAYIDPLTTTGTLRITGVDLTPFSPYADQYAGLAIERARISIDLSYTVAPVSTGNRLMLDLHTATLEDLLTTHNGEPILDAQSVELAGVKGNVDAGELSVETVRIVGADAIVRRNQDGGLELLHVIMDAIGSRDDDSSGDSTGVAERQKLEEIEYPVQQLLTGLRYVAQDVRAQWLLRVDNVELSESGVRIIDSAPSEPVDVAFTDVTLKAGPMTSADGFRTEMRASLLDPDGARLAIEGVLDPGAGSIEAQVLVEQFGLERYAIYVPRDLPGELAGIRLDSVTVSLDGKITAQASEQSYASTWEGAVTISEFVAAREGERGSLAFDSLALNGTLEARALIDRSGLTGTWDGTVVITGVAGDAPLRGQTANARLQSASAEGGLRLDSRAGGVDLAWEGAAQINGFSGDASIDGRAITLALKVANIDGPVRVDTGGGAMDLSWQGNASITGIDGAAGGAPSGSFQLDSGGLADAQFSWSAEDRALSAALLELSGRDAQAIFEKITESVTESADGRTEINLAGLPLEIDIERIILKQASYAIEDRTRQTTISLSGSDLIAMIEEISTSSDTPARIDFQTQVIDVGRLSIKGTADIFREMADVDLVITLQDMALRPFSAVAEPQLGYAIASGRMELNLPVTIVDGKLNGKLDATLRSFELGERVPSDTATSLPVKLGIDLLKDPNGDLNISVGLSGDTTDPSFRYDDMIWKAIFSLVGNVATAPFKLFATLVGAGEDVDLSRVDFVPGGIEPVEGGVQKLDLLAEALKKRPGIRLSLVGVTSDADASALRGSLLEETIRDRATGDTDEARETALRLLYAERFPDDETGGIPVPPGRLRSSELSADDMRARLLGTVETPAEALAALGTARSERVRSILVDQGGIDAARISLSALEQASRARDIKPSSSVEFELLAGE